MRGLREFPQGLAAVLPHVRYLITQHRRSFFLSISGWLFCALYILYDYAGYRELVFAHLVAPPYLYEMFFHVFMLLFCPVFFMFIGYQDCGKTAYLLELEEITAKWKKTFDTFPDLIFILDSNHRVLDANSSTKRKFGGDIIGSTFCYSALGQHCVTHETCPHNRCISGNRTIQEELFNGGAYELTCTPIIGSRGDVIGSVHIIKDVTEKKRAEEERLELEAQLLQAQKMESMGRFAGGIAHDFNNVIVAIAGFADLLLLRRDHDPVTDRYVREIKSAADQATKLTSSLLAFARKKVMSPRAVDIGKTVIRISGLLEGIMGKHIAVRILPSHDDLIVCADEGQIERVLMNLAANARDAMPCGGMVTIAACIRRGAEMHHAGCGQPGRDFAEVSFSDTGDGMEEEVKKRIFEPFYTTKTQGKGTGLGLATCYSIIQQHTGFIDVASEKGRGTTFRILLPLAKTGD